MANTSESGGQKGLRLSLRRNRILSTKSSSSSDEEIPRKRSNDVDSSEDEAPPKRRRRTTGQTVDIATLVEALTQNKSQTFMSSQQMLNALPEFDPENKGQNIDIWLHKVNEYARIYSWNDRQTAHYATQRLIGTAKNWLYSLPSLDFTWAEWQSKLKRAFPVDDNFAIMLEEMFARKTKPEESLRIYFYDKLMLLNRCGITGKKAVDCVIHGFTDASLRNSAQALKCEDPEDLLKYLIIQQPQAAFSNTLKKRGFPNRPESNLSRSRIIRCYNCGVEGHTSNRCNRQKNEKPSTSMNQAATFKCFNCGEGGHRFVNCPKILLKCTICNKIGHSEDKCNRGPLSRNNAQKVLKIDCNDGNDKFNKDLVIDNKTFKAYIDFGSECSLVQSEVAKMLKLPTNTDNLPLIRGFGNQLVTPLYKTKVQIKIDDVESVVDVLVVDDSFLQSPFLIGQNFTELPEVVVLKDSAKLTFYTRPVLHTELEIIKLQAEDTFELKGVQLIAVTSDPPFTGDIYVEPRIRNEPNKEYRVHQGVYRLNKGQGSIVLSNISGKSFHLDKGRLISRATTFTEANIFDVKRIEKKNHGESLPPLKKEEIKVGTNINAAQFHRLFNLLQNYRDCFALSQNEIGCVSNDFEMRIELSDNRPVVYRPYRLAHCERTKVREMISELIDNNIIRESNSDYASPILMVKKKSGEQRLCVDYRALNNKTIKDRYPLPLIEDQISNLSGNNYFTTLDMASGYYQVPLSENSKHLTAFVTPDGHYEFNRMPFGLANAPAVFQKLIHKILGPKRYDSVLAYMDDLLIPTKCIDEGFVKLEEVLNLLRDYGLTLKLSKCCFFATSIEYLGYEVSADGIKPSGAKTKAISEFPVPKSVHEVRQFLGLASYFRKFVKGFGEIARPLTHLLKKQVEWRWTNVEAQAVAKLKEILCSRPVLALYDPQLKTELHTDASAIGILMQWQKNSQELKPVAYFSRQTSPEEKFYHSYELETLAVVCSLKKFRTYLLGTHFKIFTDCKALRLTLSKKDLMPKIARWLLQMEEYDFEIEYRPGDRMAHVDALSRNPVENYNDDCALENIISVLNIQQSDWLLCLQLADPEINRITNMLKTDTDGEVKDIKKHFVLKNNALYRKITDGCKSELRLVIPKGARWQICRLNHDEIGHFGIKKTTERIQSQYWFPKMTRFIKKYVNACLNCAYNKDDVPTKQGHIYPIEKGNVPFQTVHIDHLGPFVKSKRGNSYILTVVDGFSKYVFVKPVKDTKSSSAIKVLQTIFQDFGTPERIISDRGTAFTSHMFKKFCQERNIRHVLNSVACPRANGQVERFNQTILRSLATQNSQHNEKDWDLAIAKVQFGINNTINSTTGKSASEVLFGVRLRGGGDNLLKDALQETVNKKQTNFEEDRDKVAETIKNKQNKIKESHNSKTTPARQYNLNDLVKITKVSFNENIGKSKKLLPKFIGPYQVTKILGNDRYQVSNIPGFAKTKKYVTVVSADRMRPWINVKSLNVMSDEDSSNTE